jgi:hypothetical protein
MNPPRARTNELLRTDLADEVVIYDPDSKRAHSLNRLAAAVWKNCDGNNTLADLGQLVSAEIGSPIGETAIWAALRQLEHADLLAQRLDDVGGKTLGRREMLRKAGQIGAAAAITPVVASILVPTAAAAASVGRIPLGIFAGLAFYQPGAPADLVGGPRGNPDTSFVRITNNGTGTFMGTLGFHAVSCGSYGSVSGPFNPSYPVTLIPGGHVSVSFNFEGSNFGGYNGLCGQTATPQNGAQFLMSGVVTLGAQTQPVSFSIYDKDIHSGVFATNGYAVNLDNYILQGGDPYGRDTGDTFEVAQAQGLFSFTS